MKLKQGKNENYLRQKINYNIYAIRRGGIGQLESYFGSILLLFPTKVTESCPQPAKTNVSPGSLPLWTFRTEERLYLNGRIFKKKKWRKWGFS